MDLSRLGTAIGILLGLGSIIGIFYYIAQAFIRVQDNKDSSKNLELFKKDIELELEKIRKDVVSLVKDRDDVKRELDNVTNKFQSIIDKLLTFLGEKK